MRRLGQICMAAALLLWAPSALRAGDFHGSSTELCSDCHSMHASQAGQPAVLQGEGPYMNLLKASSTNALCLSCHDGNSEIPDVMGSQSQGYAAGDECSGAGFFAADGTTNPHGHSLGVPVSVPLAATPATMTLSCASCHDPHGTPNYRNLKSRPGAGPGATVVSGTNVFQKIAPDGGSTAGGSVGNARAAYTESNIGYKSGFSAWCAQCHTALAANTAASAPAHFQGHPSDEAINTPGYHTDPSHWIAGTGLGFGDGITQASGGAEGIPRVRYQVPTATSYFTARPVAMNGTEQVSCVSCHRAHGSSYDAGLVWPFRGDGTGGSPNPVLDMGSACAQCHNK